MLTYVTSRRYSILYIILCILIHQSGCGPAGPQIATVEGVVTLDGKPLPKVDLIFNPQNVPGRASVGQTKEDGSYKLIYSTEKLGALVDKHKVEVTYSNPEDGVTNLKIPENYQGDQTELTYEVVSGNNVINIELKSKK